MNRASDAAPPNRKCKPRRIGDGPYPQTLSGTGPEQTPQERGSTHCPGYAMPDNMADPAGAGTNRADQSRPDVCARADPAGTGMTQPHGNRRGRRGRKPRRDGDQHDAGTATAARIPQTPHENGRRETPLPEIPGQRAGTAGPDTLQALEMELDHREEPGTALAEDRSGTRPRNGESDSWDRYTYTETGRDRLNRTPRGRHPLREAIPNPETRFIIATGRNPARGTFSTATTAGRLPADSLPAAGDAMNTALPPGWKRHGRK